MNDENKNVTNAENGEPLQEVEVVASRDSTRFYNPDLFIGQSFLKSAKFFVRFDKLPNMALDSISAVPGKSLIRTSELLDKNKIRNLSFLCDSVEFPGQTLTTSEYRIPGKLKIKAPYMRDMNEITLSFYHDRKIPVYKIFEDWIYNASPTNTRNAYFDDIVGNMTIIQFSEIQSDTVSGQMSKYMETNIINALPLNFTSMPSNWADEGFHKISATFFYENMYTKIVDRTRTDSSLLKYLPNFGNLA